MAKKTIHVVPSKSGWSVRKSGATRASKTFKTKQDATTYGIEHGKKASTELFIHNRDGKIASKRSYGNDPYPPRDKK